MKTFFLKADCMNPPKIWRYCKVLSKLQMIGSSSKLYHVEVDPPFESEVLDIKSFKQVLLGMTSSKWSLDRIGAPYFMVDIFYTTEPRHSSQIDKSAIKRLGMGIISDVNPDQK